MDVSDFVFIRDNRIRFDGTPLVGDRITLKDGRRGVIIALRNGADQIVAVPEEMIDADRWERIYRGDYQFLEAIRWPH